MDALARSSKNPPGLRGAVALFLVPTVLALVAWIWCYLAWTNLPDVSMGTEEQQKNMLYLASEVPQLVTAGLAALAGLAGTIYLVAKGRPLLATGFFMYQMPVQLAIFVASIRFINFKPPGW